MNIQRKFILLFLISALTFLDAGAQSFVCSPGTRPMNNSCRLKPCTSALNCDAGQVCTNKECKCPTGQIFCNNMCISATCCPILNNVTARIDITENSNITNRIKLSEDKIINSGELFNLYTSGGGFSPDDALSVDEASPYISLRRNDGFVEFFAFGKNNVNKEANITGTISIFGADIVGLYEGLISTMIITNLEDDTDSVRQTSKYQISFMLNLSSDGTGDGIRIYYANICSNDAPCVNNQCVVCNSNQKLCGIQCKTGNCCKNLDCVSINGGTCINNQCIKCASSEVLCMDGCYAGNCCVSNDCPNFNQICTNNSCIFPDSDSDGLIDLNEDVNGDGNLLNDDTDYDGIPNYLDADDDGDGIPTKNEINGSPLPDADGDSVPDHLESNTDDLDNDGLKNFKDADDDGDKIPTIQEDPNNTDNLFDDDTDGNKIPNFLDPDDDGDTILTIDEDSNNNGNPADDNDDQDGRPNYLDPDDDNDTISTKDEDIDKDGDPTNDDTDRDGLPNYLDPDDDNDSIPTSQEDTNSDKNPSNDDLDGDTIPNYLEPNNADTDDDGRNNNNDTDDDGDGIPTKNEDANKDGNLFNDDTDEDGIPDYLDGDDDNDGVPTIDEDVDNDGDTKNDDMDRDGIPNYIDDDDDDDGILTEDEDLNNDGNPLNDDSDFDTVPDYLEPNDLDIDKDGLPNNLDSNDDGDFLFTIDEDTNRDGNLFNDDKDGDGGPDFLDHEEAVCTYGKIVCPLKGCVEAECCDDLDCLIGYACSSGKCTNNLDTDDAKVISSPKVPRLVELPAIPDDLIGEIGFAYPDSNPSYEIDFPNLPNTGLNVKRIDIVDNEKSIYRSISHNVLADSKNPTIYVITLTTPKNIAVGRSTAYIYTHEGKIYEAYIEIVKPVQLVKARSVATNTVVKLRKKAIVEKINLIKKSTDIRMKVTGSDFPHNSVLYLDQNGEVKSFSTKEKPNPNIEIAIYPKSLGLTELYKVVTGVHTTVRLKYSASSDVPAIRKAKIVIVTPQTQLTKDIYLEPGDQVETFKF